MKIDVIIPVYKPGEELFSLLDRLLQQTCKPEHIYLVNTEKQYFEHLISESDFVKKYAETVSLTHIGREEFDHGKTRADAVKASGADVFVMMTMDALPADKHLLEKLTAPLKEEGIAAAYARQLPKKDCNFLERFTRQFNYSEESFLKTEADLERLGIKTFFCSNVCAAYKREVYDTLGGFPTKAIFNEDMIYASRVIRAGYGIAYVAEARVFHSHNYSGLQQFHRNFDLGVSQAENPDVFANVPSEKEGVRLVEKTTKYLLDRGKLLWILKFYFQCACKYAGYLLGKNYKKLPRKVILKCTSNSAYWEHTGNS